MIRTSGLQDSPGWILKSSRGTELAVRPMCCRTSSSSPVVGQVMLLGSPSVLKKSTGTNSVTQTQTQETFYYELQDFSSPGHGESSQCRMCKIFSSLELVYASSQILSYLATSSCSHISLTCVGNIKKCRD